MKIDIEIPKWVCTLVLLAYMVAILYTYILAILKAFGVDG